MTTRTSLLGKIVTVDFGEADDPTLQAWHDEMTKDQWSVVSDDDAGLMLRSTKLGSHVTIFCKRSEVTEVVATDVDLGLIPLDVAEAVLRQLEEIDPYESVIAVEQFRAMLAMRIAQARLAAR